MTPPLIFVVRHAQSEHHVRGLSGGWTDTSLTALGHEQSRLLAARLRSELADTPIRLYSSDLARASETAAHIAEQLGVEPILDARLREHNNGIAANMTIADVRAQFPNALSCGIDERPYPEAETAREFHARAGAFLEGLPEGGGVPVVVSHGGTISHLVSCWLKLPVEAADGIGFAMHTTGITVLLRQPWGEHVVERSNDVAHLSGVGGWVGLGELVRVVEPPPDA